MRRLLDRTGLVTGKMGRTARGLADVIAALLGPEAQARWLWNGPDRPVIVVIAPGRPFERRALAAALAAEWRAVSPRGPEATFILLDDGDEQARSLVERTMIPLKRSGVRATPPAVTASSTRAPAHPPGS
ncbi:hypothetical protein [Sphingomonas sp. TX0522]|uniref:hypothetical protein n=1 Tax=Sphingomonas sp. TX0522 TaxID=2479205 RepID=UPI0018E01511|nr:hypothetical protein [Sphingomonas sp. TX0522]